MFKETWAEIDGYPLYAVSNTGYVSNLRRGEELRPRDNGRGYLQVMLSNSRTQNFYIHLLVAECFLDGYERGNRHLLVKHKDDDRWNNDVRNLEISNLPAHNDRTLAPGVIYRGRPVRIVETGEQFHSARHAADVLEGSYDRIYKCLANPRMTHRGYRFEYVER